MRWLDKKPSVWRRCALMIGIGCVSVWTSCAGSPTPPKCDCGRWEQELTYYTERYFEALEDIGNLRQQLKACHEGARSRPALQIVSAFDDVASCTVQGYVSRFPGEPLSWTRIDHCPSVRAEASDDALVFYSSRVWVRVRIDPDRGYRRVQYRWGAIVAHLDGQTIPIEWGWVLKP